MRRLALFCAFLLAVAAPAVALAAHEGFDGSVVVKNGTGSGKTPVVVLHVTGSVIGEVDGQGKITVDPGVGGVPPQVTGTNLATQSDPDSTSQTWKSGPDGFKFRAVNGTFTILIWGSQVNLVALGKGWVKLAGSQDIPKSDGRFSLNGDDWKSLPGTQSDRLVFPASNG